MATKFPPFPFQETVPLEGRVHANNQRRVIRNRATEDYGQFVENTVTGNNEFWAKVAYLRDQLTTEVKPWYMTLPTERENRVDARTKVAHVAGLPGHIDVYDSDRRDGLTVRRVSMWEAKHRQEHDGKNAIRSGNFGSGCY